MDLKEKTNINILNAVPNALLGPSACPGKSAPKNRTAVYLDFHCSENGNGWLWGEGSLLGMRAFLVVFYS